MNAHVALKPYTLYRCPTGDGRHGSVWTGALTQPDRTRATCYTCGEDFVEVVEDGHTYRLTWEMGNPHDDGWHPVTKDSTDSVAIIEQWRTLTDWAMTGAERIRNVALARAATVWQPFAPDASDPS